MALRYVNPRASTNGDGTSWGNALNTFAGLTWGSNHYLIGPGTLNETITFGASGAHLMALDPDELPVIDCQGTRNAGINMNNATGCSASLLLVVNQNAAPPDGAVRVSGSGHQFTGMRFQNNRCDFHVNNSARNRWRGCWTALGNSAQLAIAQHVRINGASSIGNVISDFEITTGAPLTYGTGIEVYAGQNNILRSGLITCRSIDGVLMREAASGNTLESTVIDGDLKDCIALENAQDNTVRNNSVNQRGGIGDTYPCLKLGDDFGDKPAAAGNGVYNNALRSANSLPVVINGADATNLYNGNRVWRASGGTLFRYDLKEGATDNFLTWAQWQALGYDAAGENEDMDWLAGLLVPAGSSLLTSGADIGYVRDFRGLQSRRHVGAYGDARLV